MATWDELRAFFAPPGVRMRGVEGPPLGEVAGAQVVPSTHPVLGLAWSGDGRRLALASGGRIAEADGLVRVAEPATGRTMLLHGHARGVHAVAFDARTGWLASAGHDGAVVLWDLDRGEGFPIAGPRPRARVGFAGDRLLVGDELPEPGQAGAFWVVDLSAPDLREQALPADYLVQGFAVGGDRIALLLFHADGAQRLECRTFPEWEPRWAIDVDDHVNGLAWADGLLIARSDATGVRRVERRDVGTGEVRQARVIGRTRLGGMHVDAPRGRFATIGAEGVLGLWRLDDLEPIAAIPVDGFRGASVAVSPDGTRVALGSATGDGARILSLR